MTVEKNASVMRLVPHTASVVEEHDHWLAIQLQLVVVLNGNQLAVLEKAITILDDLFVVVSKNQMDIAVESPQQPLQLVHRHEGKVTIMVNIVSWLDKMIPLLNHLLIHLIHILVRTLGILDDVGVPEVGIASKPSVHVSRCLVG